MAGAIDFFVGFDLVDRCPAVLTDVLELGTFDEGFVEDSISADREDVIDGDIVFSAADLVYIVHNVVSAVFFLVKWGVAVIKFFWMFFVPMLGNSTGNLDDRIVSERGVADPALAQFYRGVSPDVFFVVYCH